ncbi:hypothetical protein Rhopal_005510-T1 [Rhodotorula paludigena]|uniref:glucan 1,3-beta-glucosidase n=1 Tax=Rhodotorula paludigena TaxID=86838 RepID=A0AAV5GIK1_9BASI|nr:hypothetical protein Rhopal_005510-T1 [Rhodotorula paludigena]
MPGVYGASSNSYAQQSSADYLHEGEKPASHPPVRSSFATSHMVARSPRRTWWWIGGITAAICVILAAVLGGVLGSRAANDNDDANSGNVRAADSNSGGSSASGSASRAASSSSSGTATSSSAAASSTAAGPLVQIVDLPAWNWGTNKSVGVCLGNWLQLEKWMAPDWFNETVNAVQPGSGATALDEWSMSEILGQDRLRTALSQHWETWVTEDDFDTMHEYGINHVRVPVPFWAFISTTGDEPYLNDQAAYQAQIERVLGYAYNRGMYALLDFHGLPGSQNGEQSSGHLTENPSWFGGSADTETPNQLRSDEMVKAATEWLAQTPYRSVVSGIEVINEPRPYTDDQIQQLENYYERSYATIQSSAWPVATFLHNGYTNLTYWQSFAAAHATQPPSMVMVDHPYPGNFPPQTDADNILQQVCSAADRYLGYPIPICINEWSIYTGVKTQDFEKEFYEQQLVTWAWSAGSMYWSWRLETSAQDLMNGLDYSQYSFVTLLQNSSSVIPKPSDYGSAQTTSLEGTQSFLQSVASDLDSSCGTAPSNVAPYNSGDVPAWTAEVSARSSAQGQTLTATSTTATTTATARLMHKKRAVPMRA